MEDLPQPPSPQMVIVMRSGVGEDIVYEGEGEGEVGW